MSNINIANLRITIETGNGVVSELACIRLALEGGAVASFVPDVPPLLGDLPPSEPVVAADRLTADPVAEILADIASVAAQVTAAPEPEKPTVTRKKAVKKAKDGRGRAKAVIAEGVRYPSYAAAAQSLDVTPQTIANRIKHGVEGYREVAVRGKLRAVVLNGVTYRSKMAAAKALGRSLPFFKRRLNAGAEGYSYAAD